jgi:hypothetical protein
MLLKYNNISLLDNIMRKMFEKVVKNLIMLLRVSHLHNPSRYWLAESAGEISVWNDIEDNIIVSSSIPSCITSDISRTMSLRCVSSGSTKHLYKSTGRHPLNRRPRWRANTHGRSTSTTSKITVIFTVIQSYCDIYNLYTTWVALLKTALSSKKM